MFELVRDIAAKLATRPLKHRANASADIVLNSTARSVIGAELCACVESDAVVVDTAISTVSLRALMPRWRTRAYICVGSWTYLSGEAFVKLMRCWHSFMT